jgi:hypothetical protein
MTSSNTTKKEVVPNEGVIQNGISHETTLTHVS